MSSNNGRLYNGVGVGSEEKLHSKYKHLHLQWYNGRKNYKNAMYSLWGRQQVATAGAPTTPSRGQGPREIKKSGPPAQPETQTKPGASQNYSDHQQRACHTIASSKSPTHPKTPGDTPGAEQTLLPQTAVASFSLRGAHDRGIRRFLPHHPTQQRCMLHTCEGAGVYMWLLSLGVTARARPPRC